MNPHHLISRRDRFHAKTTARCGAAVVEFAVCLPLIMLLILGSIEASSSIALKHGLTTAAYEGIREAVKSASTAQDARDRAQAIIDARRIRGSTITFIPSDLSTARRGERVAVEVAAPLKQNSPFIGKVIANRTATARVVMVKE
jgi:Flp pilus assembly protein TadG